MPSDTPARNGTWGSVLTGACLIAFGCAGQAAFAPTVRVTCPARTSTAPDCDLRRLLAYDLLRVWSPTKTPPPST